MNNKTVFVMLYCMIILSIGTFSLFGQEKEIDLKDKRITIKMEKQPLGEVFRYLMENYDIPIGFEESILDRGISDYDFQTNLPSVAQLKTQNAQSIKYTLKAKQVFKAELHPITVIVENERLEVVFNQIVKQMENYKWEINNDVINIFPIKGRDERFENLLKLRIKRFTLEKGKTVEDITKTIQSLDEFLRFMYKNKIVFIGFRQGANFSIKAQYGKAINEDMDFSNLTFRELLNKITKIKRGGWVLKWLQISPKLGEEIDIDI